MQPKAFNGVPCISSRFAQLHCMCVAMLFRFSFSWGPAVFFVLFGDRRPGLASPPPQLSPLSREPRGGEHGGEREGHMPLVRQPCHTQRTRVTDRALPLPPPWGPTDTARRPAAVDRWLMDDSSAGRASSAMLAPDIGPRLPSVGLIRTGCCLLLAGGCSCWLVGLLAGAIVGWFVGRCCGWLVWLVGWFRIGRRWIG